MICSDLVAPCSMLACEVCDQLKSDCKLPQCLMQVGVCLQTAALTFDDAPDAAGNTDKVLDALKAAGVKATFYVNGNNWCDSRAAPCSTTLARIKAEGHDIAGHTMTHPHTDTLTDAQINTEFSALNSLVGQQMTVCVHMQYTNSNNFPVPVVVIDVVQSASLFNVACAYRLLLQSTAYNNS